MRGEDWLQKLLYLIMVILAGYIFYKGAGMLLGSAAVQSSLDSGSVQRSLEDAAMRTYAPGYTAVVEGRESSGWMSGWMKQIAPVYSYLADGQAGGETEQNSAGEGETKLQQTDGETGVQDGISQVQRTADQAGENALGEEDFRSGQEPSQDAPGSATDQTGENALDETDMLDIAADGDGSLPNETMTADEEANGGGAGSTKQTEALLEDEAQEAAASGVSDILWEQLEDFDYLLANYYTVDGGTVADDELLDVDALLGQDLRIEQNPDVPQILIYHTHSQEAFLDSAKGEVSDTIVGMGEVLAGELRACGYNVIHDTGVYDLVDGVLDRSAAYDYARAAVQQILEENPTIEVIIDLHRDGVDDLKLATEIDGRPTSMVMFFNGISRNNLAEPLYGLENPYIEQNLAFSLQLELKAREQYPGFTRNIYLKAERFNLHLRPRSLLIEAGTQLNTVEEERNAMPPLADLIDQVLSGV